MPLISDTSPLSPAFGRNIRTKHVVGGVAADHQGVRRGWCWLLCLQHQIGGATWARFFGPLSDHKGEYLDHHASHDPFKPAVAASTQARWLALSEALSENTLRHNEWYNDFVRSSGINDIQGVQLHRNGPHCVFFGIHYQTVQTAPPQQDPRLQLLLNHLEHAARLEHMQQRLNLKTALGNWVIDHLDEALFVGDENDALSE